jgi:hypothetical protein
MRFAANWLGNGKGLFCDCCLIECEAIGWIRANALIVVGAKANLNYVNQLIR